MGDVLVLWYFRSSDSKCQSFNKYVLTPRGSTYAEAFNLAVEFAYQAFERKYQGGAFTNEVCDPATYTIEPGPNLNEAL